jgi:hypothetical protein
MKKRVLVVLAVAVASLAGGVMNVSAGSYCSLDPTVGVGVPVLKLALNVNVLGSKVYASTNGSSTTFGGGVYIP